MRRQAVAIYARYSTDRQDERSIDDQLRRCHEFAAAREMRVVAEYTDAAQSGAHMDRAELKRLLADARERGGSPFEAVLVYDLSRLSRDLGNTWRIIFEDLHAANVKVIDATTGMASDGAGGRLAFGAMALVNDQYLEVTRRATHRGLEGRAEKGFSTGGRIYGYRTEKEANPEVPEHPRHQWKIFPEEAEVVRGIFRMYAGGMGFKAIAHELNTRGIRAPYDSIRSKPRGRGWSSGTIRAILLSKRYLGEFTWNARRWIRDPARKSRRCVPRPEAEWKTYVRPELAIIDDDLWAAVQARFKGRARPSAGRPVGTGLSAYLMSGILRCGDCGARMGIVGTKKKGAHRYATYGCSAHRTKGPSVCANSATVSERKASQAIVGALRDALLRADLLKRIVARFNEAAARRDAKPDDDSREVDRAIAETELRVRNLTNAVADGEWSDSLKARLQEEEGRLRELRERQKALSAPRGPARTTLNAEEVENLVRDLLGSLDVDPRAGQQFLARNVGDVTLTPKMDASGRYYEATGACNISAIILPDRRDRVLTNSHCGGWI